MIQPRLLLLFILLLLAPAALPAQINVGIGMQGGFTSMPNADVVTDRYNSHGFLYRKMRRFHFPIGEIYLASIRHNRWLAELNMNTRRNRVSAESFNGNVLHRRDVRFTMQSFSFGGGYAAVDQDNFVLYLCGAIDLGYMKLSTRQGPKESIGRSPYYMFDRRGMIALSTYLKMVFRSDREAITSYSISPYFHFPLSDFDFVYLNQVLNTQDWTLDGPNPTAPPWNVGLMVNFDRDLLRFLQ